MTLVWRSWSGRVLINPVLQNRSLMSASLRLRPPSCGDAPCRDGPIPDSSPLYNEDKDVALSGRACGSAHAALFDTDQRTWAWYGL
jgi:hypothetical protein